MNLLGSTVDFLSSQMSNGSMDTELVQSLGTSLFSGIGNVLGVASGEAGAESDDAEGEDEEDTDSDKGQVDSDEMKEKVNLSSSSDHFLCLKDCALILL